MKRTMKFLVKPLIAIFNIFQISKDTFDESPFAYRPLDDIAEAIKDIPVNDEDIFNTCM